MPTIVHFDLPADNPKRAKMFYEALFNWNFNLVPEMEYYLVETKDLEGEQSVGGGMAKRRSPEQQITNYIGVDSVDNHITKVEELGGKIVTPKQTVPGFGYLAVCMDTENNTFGLWEDDKSAK
ncbi:MAG: VOC family protein [Spirochaetota bacterium]|nr:MAG: VOC family protein [Spirochaetota bacterium]